MGCDDIFDKLKDALQAQVDLNKLDDKPVSIRFKPLTPEEAMGKPEDQDYPIITGRERIVEASFLGQKGHAFTDEYGDANYTVKKIMTMDLDSNRKRADFIAAFNAIYRYLGLCEKTVHCRDLEPVECAKGLLKKFDPGIKVLLIGLQPRFLEYLVKKCKVRVIDLDQEKVGSEKFGVIIEAAEKTDEAVEWADQLFVTGSVIVNGTIDKFVNCSKPTLFYGVTISGPAKVLGLKLYCEKGH